MLPDLEGMWRIERRIIHQNARFEGILNFKRSGDDLIYTEKGLMRLPTATTEAYRSYIYRPSAQEWQVFYDDGRPFLNLKFEQGVARYTHDCTPDIYRATFKIKNKNEWICAFLVSGPRKNYFAVSRMTKL
ncbi:MAG TPA: DUF6314 family protein [Alphaproteobacteria bacterium]